MRNFAAASMITIAALTVAGGTAGAAPAPVAPQGGFTVPIVPGVINYTTNNDGNSAVVTTDAGSLVVKDGQFQILSPAGDIVGGVPLEVNVEDIVYPVRATIEGNRATLTPVVEAAFYRPAVFAPKQVAASTPEQREQAAWSKFGSRLSVGAAVGAIIGAIGAGVVGCVAGGVLGLGLTLPVALLLGGGPIAGCLAGAMTLGPLGAMAGTIVVGAPVAIAAAIEYFNAVNAPLAPEEPKK
ncbi:hypothetical protein ACFVMC_21610 [Nocardia sp. NPDC127579]|uniref:hypothetical protein n=1 Tax=Nocardia sp. NPDC127579 TaxID=3345402 RepID=UPI0036418BC3